MLHFLDFFRYVQINLLKIIAIATVGIFTHYMEKIWCVEVKILIL